MVPALMVRLENCFTTTSPSCTLPEADVAAGGERSIGAVAPEVHLRHVAAEPIERARLRRGSDR